MYNRCIYSVEVVHAKLSRYVIAYFNLYNDSNDLCLVIRADFSSNIKTFWSTNSFNHFIYWLSNLTRLADRGKVPGYKETMHFC